MFLLERNDEGRIREWESFCELLFWRIHQAWKCLIRVITLSQHTTTNEHFYTIKSSQIVGCQATVDFPSHWKAFQWKLHFHAEWRFMCGAKSAIKSLFEWKLLVRVFNWTEQCKFATSLAFIKTHKNTCQNTSRSWLNLKHPTLSKTTCIYYLWV